MSSLSKRAFPLLPKPRSTNALVWHARYGTALLFINIATVAFWGGTLARPIHFSASSTDSFGSYATLATYFWTLCGSLLAIGTTWLFHKLLSMTFCQILLKQGATIGTFEFWFKLSTFKILPVLSLDRIKLSAASIAFAVVVGTLTPGFTALVTPKLILLTQATTAVDVDFTSPEFQQWYADRGQLLTSNCSAWHRFTRPFRPSSILGSLDGPYVMSLASCPEIQEYINAAAATSAFYNNQGPGDQINFFGVSFTDSTGGVIPLGPFGLQWWADFDYGPKLMREWYIRGINYTFFQQALDVNAQCFVVGEDSNIDWSDKTHISNTNSDDGSIGQVYDKNISCTPPNNETQTYRITSGPNFVGAFGYGLANNSYAIEVGAFGSYSDDYSFRNMTCFVTPTLITTQVAAQAPSAITYMAPFIAWPVAQLSYLSPYAPHPTPKYALTNRAGLLAESLFAAPVTLLRTASTVSGNQIVDGIANVLRQFSQDETTDEEMIIEAMESMIQATMMYHASYIRLLAMLDMWVTGHNTSANGLYTISGFVQSWTLGYDGDVVVAYTLFPPLAILLCCATVVVTLGVCTGIKEIPSFDPTNPADLIAASAVGGSLGLLPDLKEDSLEERTRAVGVRIRFHDNFGFQSIKGG